MIDIEKKLQRSNYGRIVLNWVKNSIYRNSFFLLANTVLTSGLGLFFWMVVARYYSTADIGLAAALFSVLSLLSMLGLVGLGDALIRFLPGDSKPAEMINSCITVTLILSFLLAIVFVIGLNWWSPALLWLRENFVTLLAFLLLSPVWTISTLLDSVFIAGRRADFVLYKNTSISVIKIPLAVLFAFVFRAFGIVGSQGIATGVLIVASLVFFVPRIQRGYRFIPSVSTEIPRKILPYSAGLYFASILDTISNQFLSILVVNLLGAEQNAYYYVTWTIVNMLFTVPVVVSNVLFAEVSHSEREMPIKIRQSFLFSFLLMIPAIIILILSASFVLNLFGTAYSASGVLLMRLFALSGIFVTINAMYGSILRIKKRIKEIAVLVVIKSVTVLAGCYFLLPLMGVSGIGYVWITIQGLVSAYIIISTFVVSGIQKKFSIPKIQRHNDSLI